MFDTIEQVLHQHVQDVKRVILCRSLQLVAKRQQRRAPATSVLVKRALVAADRRR